MHDIRQADCSASHQGEGGAFADPPTKGPLDVGTLNGMFACWGPRRAALRRSCRSLSSNRRAWTE